MGKAILCTGLEKNIGVTTAALLLAKILAEKLDSKVLVVDINIENPEISSILAGEEKSLHNIDIVMNYTLSEKNIKTVIAGNVETLSNSKIEILMGTNINEQFTDDQYVTFITQAAQMYDFVFLDSSLPELKQAVIDYSDMVFCFVNPSQKQLRKLKKYYWKVLNEEKTEVILNKYEKGVMGRSEIAKILEKKPKHVVSYDKKVLHAANSGDLNLGETKANDDLAAIADYLIDRYGLRKKKWYETLFKIPSLKNKEALDVKPTE